jgi:mxaA protein
MASGIFAINLCVGIVRADALSDLNVQPPANAIVAQPRPFGYVIGDLLTQRVLLQLQGHTFEPASLPPAQRVNAWLERRSPRIDSSPDGRRWLSVEYQVINAPQALTLIRIPPWSLNPKSGTDMLRIGEWPISLSPLTPRSVFAQGDLSELRPDRPAPRIAIDPIRHRAVLWSSALALTLVMWLGWWLWRQMRDAAMRPFAIALREIRRSGENSPEAWQALHRALDRTAGRVTQNATLPSLFETAPHLAPLKGSIEQFFAESRDRFFGSGASQHSLSVRALCTELRRIERSH